MSRRFFVVANPASGRQRIGRVLRSLRDYLSQHDCDFQLFETSFEKRGHKTVEENLDSSYTDLVIVGGDGSINEAVNGLQTNATVSFIPAGTGDDFVKTLDIGRKLEDHFDTMLHGMEHLIDLGLCNDRKFLNGVGIGFDGQIVADMLQKTVSYLSGQAKYYYHVLQILSTYKERTFRGLMEGESYKEDLILMTIAKGTTFGGGFKLTPGARLQDGFLQVCEIGPISPISRYLNVLKLQNGSHGSLGAVRFRKVKYLEIQQNDNLQAHIDGELLGAPPFKISVLPANLKIRARAILT
jgi:YegS/Rv2252/BmrU family lipid kinase